MHVAKQHQPQQPEQGARVVCLHRTKERPICEACAEPQPRKVGEGRYILAKIAPGWVR